MVAKGDPPPFAEPTDRDQYDGLVANLRLPDGCSLNREMVRAGLAWWYCRYAPNDGELARLEAEARNAQRGLWVNPNPVPPWSWRRPSVKMRCAP
jgi:micrococcal nuclease